VFAFQSKSVVAVTVGVRVGVEVGAVAVGDGGLVAVGEGVIVRVGVLVSVGVIVGVLGGRGVLVAVGVKGGVGNVTGAAGRDRLQAASLNWIEKPKFAALRFNGGSLSLPPKPPSQSMRILLAPAPRFTALFKPTEVVEE